MPFLSRCGGTGHRISGVHWNLVGGVTGLQAVKRSLAVGVVDARKDLRPALLHHPEDSGRVLQGS